MELDVIYARALKPGDLWAGTIDPSAPTRPVNNFAHAMRLSHTEIVKGDGGRWIVQCRAHGLALTPVPESAQVMVIRPDAREVTTCVCCVDNQCECNGANLQRS